MRMVEGDDWNLERSSARDCLPADLIGIGRLDDIRPLSRQEFARGRKVHERAVTSRSGNQRRADGINSGTFTGDDIRFLSRNNENVLVFRRAFLDESNLL